MALLNFDDILVIFVVGVWKIIIKCTIQNIYFTRLMVFLSNLIKIFFKTS